MCHITKLSVPPVIYKQRSEYRDLFVFNWPWGTTASFLWDNKLTAASFISMFFWNHRVTFMCPKRTAWNWQRRARERRTWRDEHRDHDFVTVCPGSLRVCCKQQLSDFPVSPLAAKRCFNFPSQTLPAEQRSSVTSTAEEMLSKPSSYYTHTHTYTLIQWQLLTCRCRNTHSGTHTQTHTYKN